MRNIDLFSKVNSFIELASELRTVSFFDQENEPQRLYQLKELLFENSNLYFESEEEFEKLKDSDDYFPYYKLLVKNWTSGGAEIHFAEFGKIDSQAYVEEANPNHIQSQKNIFINNKSGYFNFLKTNWKNEDKIPLLSTEEFVNVIHNSNNNEFHSWRRLFDGIQLPSNCLVIMDLYLWNDFENNLLEIISNVLPDELLLGTYDISLITSGDRNVPSRFIAKFNEIISEKDYEVRLNIFGTDSRSLHDRTILSNYWMMESGHGFDLLNSRDKLKGNKNTRILIYGINNQKISKYYKVLKERAAKIAIEDNLIYPESGYFVNKLLK